MKAIARVFSANTLSKLVLGVIGIVLIRYMSAQDYADYTYALSAAAVFDQTLVASFNRVYLVENGNFDIAELLGVQLLWLLGFLGPVLAVLAVTVDWVYWYVLLLVVGTSVLEAGKSYYQARLDFGRYSRMPVLQALIFAGGVCGLVFSSSRIPVNSSVVLTLKILATLCASLLFGRQLDIKKVVDTRHALSLSRQLLQGQFKWLFAYFALHSVFSQIGVLSLGWFGSDSDLATFGSAYRYYGLLLLGLAAVNTVLLPTVQKASDSEISTILDRHRRLTLAFMPIVLLSALAAHWFIPWIDGGKYASAIPAFRIMCVAAVTSFGLSPYLALTLKRKDFEFLVSIYLLALPGAVVANWIMLRLLNAGAVGIAASTVIAEVYILVSIYSRVRKTELVPVGRGRLARWQDR